MPEEPEEEDVDDQTDSTPSVSVYAVEGYRLVCLALLHCPIVEIGDIPVPGTVLNPDEAREIAKTLIEIADWADQQ